jgi:hypothetical protein
MDEYTNFLWSYLLNTKGEQVSSVIKHIRRLQNEPKVRDQIICCNSSKENNDTQNYLREKLPKIR